MTEEELKHDREIINAATPGPWSERDIGTEFIAEVEVPKREMIRSLQEDSVNPGNNIHFIAEARTRWPAALDEIEKYKAALTKTALLSLAEIEKLRDLLSSVSDLLQTIECEVDLGMDHSDKARLRAKTSKMTEQIKETLKG